MGLQHLGYDNSPLLWLPKGRTVLSLCMPDLLHITLRVVATLLKNSLEFVADNEVDIINELVAFFLLRVYVFETVGSTLLTHTFSLSLSHSLSLSLSLSRSCSLCLAK
jgi:hypothetical protein